MGTAFCHGYTCTRQQTGRSRVCVSVPTELSHCLSLSLCLSVKTYVRVCLFRLSSLSLSPTSGISQRNRNRHRPILPNPLTATRTTMMLQLLLFVSLRQGFCYVLLWRDVKACCVAVSLTRGGAQHLTGQKVYEYHEKQNLSTAEFKFVYLQIRMQTNLTVSRAARPPAVVRSSPERS